jgi:hypothetical protein
VWLKALGRLKKFNYFIRSWTHDIPACSIMPQPLFPNHIQLQLKFLKILCTGRNFMNGYIISMIIKKSCGGVCGHECTYSGAILHLTGLILKIILSKVLFVYFFTQLKYMKFGVKYYVNYASKFNIISSREKHYRARTRMVQKAFYMNESNYQKKDKCNWIMVRFPHIALLMLFYKTA